MNPIAITLASGKLTPSAISGQASLYDTVPVTITGVVWTAGHTYLAYLARRGTQMGGTSVIAVSFSETGVATWAFDLPFTHSALLSACTGASVPITLRLWDATAGRHVCNAPLTVQYAPQPDGWVQSDPVETAATAGQIAAAIANCVAWPTEDGEDLADEDRFPVLQLVGSVWLACVKTGTQFLAYLKAYFDTLYSAAGHSHTSGAWTIAVAVLPASPVAHTLYRLTTADAAALAAPGYYIWDGTGWRCLGYDAAYDLGSLTGSVTHALVVGLQYRATIAGIVTAWTLAASIPGMVGVVYANPSNFAVAAPTMTGKTGPAVAGAWDAANGSIVTAICEWDGTYFWATCQEGA